MNKQNPSRLWEFSYFFLCLLSLGLEDAKTMENKLRFDIFERDNFTCQYCGRKPPEVILEVDHILPKSKGGGNEKINLITSCRKCNRSKHDKILKNIDRSEIIKNELDDLKEAEIQIKDYYKYLKRISKLKKEKNPIVSLISKVWDEESGGNSSLTEQGKKNVSNLLKRFSGDEIIEAIIITWEKNYIEDERRFRYMCGILKQMKLRKDNPELAKKQENLYKNYYELLNYWKNQPKGTGYLPIYKVKEWLDNDYDVETIKRCMDLAQGNWSDLQNWISTINEFGDNLEKQKVG